MDYADTTFALVVVAGGASHRMGGDTPKVLLALQEKSVLEWSIAAFQDQSSITQRILVASQDVAEAILGENGATNGPWRRDAFAKASALGSSLSSVGIDLMVRGGDTRNESVKAGLSQVSGECQRVLIHDAARPLVSQQIISAVMGAAPSHAAVIPAIPVGDTIRQVYGGVPVTTLRRDTLRACQTPQCFDRAQLATLIADADGDETDEGILCEKAGLSVHLVEGHRHNLKITTPLDLVVARAILDS